MLRIDAFLVHEMLMQHKNLVVHEYILNEEVYSFNLFLVNLFVLFLNK